MLPSQLFAQAGGLNTPRAVGPYLNGAFPAIDPGQPADWETANAFPNLTFIDPLWMTPVPGGNDLLLVGKNGQIWRFDNNPDTIQTEVVQVLDWRAETQTSEDQGLYSLVFHPQFGLGGPNSNYTYICYSYKPNLQGAGPNRSYWRVSRFTWVPATGTLDPSSEFVLMHQYDRCRWHAGGAMFFDNSGFLNVVCGDGGDSTEGGGLYGANGALSRTQRLDHGLFSGMFRIDVNNDPTKSGPILRQPQNATGKPSEWPDSYTQGYGIPFSNPWAHLGSAVLGEYAGLGLRSPHTAHYDAVTGDVWIGDVGEKGREEMTRLPLGANAQWGYGEGSIAGPGTAAVPPIGVDILPDVDYDRSVGGCIIGGMRYRGEKWNGAFGGKIIYGDHNNGKIWTATLNPGGAPPTIERIIDGFAVGRKVGLANFCTDPAGEIYMMNINGTNQPGGTILKLIPAGASVEPPQLLSQTGFFTNLATLEALPAAIPYSVAAPLWSDASAKKRWIVLPNDGTHNTPAEDIIFDEVDPWVFPPGTVFVKHFEIGTNENDPSQVKRLETRFLVCLAGGGKYGVTYRWNSLGTDAVLLTTGESENFDVTLTNGTTENRRWEYPSRADCMQCHNDASGQALGVRTSPLNERYHYPSTGRTANQLVTFNALGMFDRTLTTSELQNFIEARAIEDAEAPVEHRVRSYLDMNCAHCHRPGGTVDAFDLRLETPLNFQGLVDATIKGTFGMGPDGRYIKPGDPDLSALHVRLMNVGNGAAMPPLAKNLVDQNAVNLLEQYITSLNPTEFETTSSPQARYVRLTAISEVLEGPWTSVAEFSVLDGEGVPIPIFELSIHDVDSEELESPFGPAVHAIDGDLGTFWHTEFGDPEPYVPHHLTVDLGTLRPVGGFVYTPRQAASGGRIGVYQVHYSTDGENWTLMTSGNWPNDAAAKRFDGLVGQRKARSEIAGPTGVVSGSFDVTVVFDMNVDDFTASDLQVAGGTVTRFRGQGYYYVATIFPTAPTVTVSVPTDAANGALLGSRASSLLTVDFLDTLPPTPVFTEVPPHATGPFQIGVTFGEPVTGLTAADFTLTNVTLDSITPSGHDYLLNLTPLIAGSPAQIELVSGAVTDLSGLVMGDGISVSVPYILQILSRNADEASFIGGDMVLATNSASPTGKYVSKESGSLTVVNPAHRAEYTFFLPKAGEWMLRALIRAPTNSNNSFFTEVNGNQGLGSINTWDVTPVGSGYTWDYMSNRDVADPVIMNLSAGSHTITFYARDPSTRLARVEMESVRPIATLATGANIVSGSFDSTLTFSEAVIGLTADDFSITGGVITSLSGSGSSYSLTIAPTSDSIEFSLPENSVTDVGGAGNFASNPIAVTYVDLPPSPTFTEVPAQVSGPFQLGLTFGEPVSGLTLSDFVVTNGTLNSLIPYGDNYLLILTPLTLGVDVEVEILDGAVTDNSGLQMEAGTSLSISFGLPVLARNADEHSYLGGKMRLVADAGAPDGHYVGIKQGDQSGNTLIPENRAEFTFIVPHAGEWKLRGLVQAPDGSGDSFHVGLNGNQSNASNWWFGIPYSNTTYYWDYVNHNNVILIADPVILNLTAGTHTITVYGREDGARLARLELESVRPTATLTSTGTLADGHFTATLEFSKEVTGLEADDFTIYGGSVTAVEGSGANYTLTIAPNPGTVTLMLPQDKVTDTNGVGNVASNPFAVTFMSAYEQWASAHGISTAPEDQLEDDDGDGISNLMEFAFGTLPHSNANGATSLQFDGTFSAGGTMVMPGQPITRFESIPHGVDFRAVFVRRVDFEDVGLNYTPQFSSNLKSWHSSVTVPTVLSDDGVHQIVSVPYPIFIAGKKARWFRLGVSMDP